MSRGHRIIAVGALTLAIPLVGGACSDDGDDVATESSSTSTSSTSSTAPSGGPVNTGPTVEVTEFAYTPSGETVGIGQTVTWTNAGNSPHTVTPRPAADGTRPFESTQIGPGETFVQTFNTAGSYSYFCSIHPDRMSGSVTVNP
jgi:plastocyanin